MIVLIGIFCFFPATYFFYSANEYSNLFKKGVHGTATVCDIEKVVAYDQNDDKVILYYLHLDLPDFHGYKLGKKYEKNIDPKKYAIGDVVEIIYNPNSPTELVIMDELTYKESPKHYVFLGLLLYLVSYVSCYVIK